MKESITLYLSIRYFLLAKTNNKFSKLDKPIENQDRSEHD